MESGRVGIDVKEWGMEIREKRKRDVVVNVWDFGGGEELYSSDGDFMREGGL